MMNGQRFHSLDACRAVMMLLGLVIHSSITYTTFAVQLSSLPVDDPEHFGWHFIDGATSPIIDLIFMFIHTFRMPVFFILAGFFTALVVSKRGVREYFSTRMMRIALPFIAIWLTFMPAERWTALFANKIAGDRESYIADHPINYFTDIWNNTGAFWFLYYLIAFAIITYAILHFSTTRNLLTSAEKALLKLSKKPITLLSTFAAFTIAMMALIADTPFLPNDQDFVPNVFLYCLYLSCFGLGAFWYKNPDMLHKIEQQVWRYVIAATLLFCIFMALAGAYFTSYTTPLFFSLANIAHGFTMWLWSFAILGLFMRFASGASKTWRYLADSSYFVYIIHAHVFLFYQGFIAHLTWHALPKLMLCIVVSFITAIILYHVFARHTWISTFLNGKRYSWKTGQVVTP